MNLKLRKIVDEVMEKSIQAVLPDAAVGRALAGRVQPKGKSYIVAVGKAAWQMADAAVKTLAYDIAGGIVITKHGYSKGAINGLEIFEAGHPVPDNATFAATQRALAMTEGLAAEDEVIFLLSGGGSALFEYPLCTAEEIADITKQLLACGASIVEINTVRKRLSAVKGGRFALHCAPAAVYSVILSDVLGDRADMIASGPSVVDQSTAEQAVEIAKKYSLEISDRVAALLEEETPKTLSNSTVAITGSVGELCRAARDLLEDAGYTVTVLTDSMTCEARHAGSFLGAVAKYHSGTDKRLAFVCGGETVVRIVGNGLGGRNQEIALAAAEHIAGIDNVAVCSFGSDGTDGPTDAAGGYADGQTEKILEANGTSSLRVLANNDAYNALLLTGGLLMTGPTGTNVNDVSIVLIN